MRTKTKTVAALGLLATLALGCGDVPVEEIGDDEAELLGCYASIDSKYLALGGPAALGNVVSYDTIDTGSTYGWVRWYERGVIAQRGGACAWAVVGGILAKWRELRGEQGWLGWPISDEEWATDSWGRVSQFEHGSIYWSPWWGAAALQAGPIRDKWLALGGVRSALGYPVGDRQKTRTGADVHSFSWGTIYQAWPSPPYAVAGGIGQLYRELGADNGPAGLPTSDEYTCWPSTLGTRCQRFQQGMITWTAAGGARYRP